MDWIKINALELDCIVGIYPHERQAAQRVRLDLALQVDTKRAGCSGRIGHTVDYALLAEHVIAMLHFRRYQLVEMAAEELCAMVLATQPEARSVQLSIEKPGALAGRASGAQIVVSRTAQDYDTNGVVCAFGKVHELLRTRDAELRVVSLDRGQSWQPAEGSLYWPIRGELSSETDQLRVGQARLAPRPTEAWRNAGQREVLIFSCALTGADQ